MSEFEPWPPQQPPDDFADRVMLAHAARRRSGVRLLLVGSVLSVAASAFLILRPGPPPPQGEAIAAERREVSLGSAVAVLEPGAQIRWKGLQIEQLGGDVFYRVDKGAPYRVSTPLGSVDVGGTCFRVRIHGTAGAPARDTPQDEGMMANSIGKIGAGVVAGALLTVGVYEGRVRVSSAGQQQALAAGDTVTVGPGALRSRDADPSASTGAAAPAPSDAEQAYQEANRSLVENVQVLNRKIAAAEEQQKQLKKELVDAQAALAAGGGAKGDGKPQKNEFDLSPDDWKKLAEDGTIKYRVPCVRSADWQPSPESIQQLGLPPEDGPMLKDAYRKSNERVWTMLRPLCAAAVGSETVAEKIGTSTCIHLVLDMNRDKDKEGTNEAMRQVGEIRAGLRPAPAPGDPQHPVLQMMMALTGELKSFESDLAQQLGPDEAHRISYADGLCAGRSTFGGPGARPKKLARFRLDVWCAFGR